MEGPNLRQGGVQALLQTMGEATEQGSIPSEQILENQKPKEGNIERLFGHCFEAAVLKEGELVPVGGTSVFSSEANIKVTGDFESFKGFFEQVHETFSKIDLPKLKEWLASSSLEIDEKLFAELFCFTKKYEKQYSIENLERSESRRKLYKEKREEVKLSDVFATDSAECGEIAALAQGYLQKEGIPSAYFSGEVLWSKDEEFPEAHSFIVIRQNGKVYLYDPSNPTNTTSGKFPSIYTTEVNFDEEVRRGQRRFVTAKNLLSKKEVFYGVSDGANVVPEKQIV